MPHLNRTRRGGLVLTAALLGLSAAGCGSTIPVTTSALPSPADAATPPSVPSPTPRMTVAGPSPNPAQPSPTIIASPAPTPEPTPEASCYDLHVEVDYIPSPLTDVARRSRSVAVGTFAGYGQAAWNTPDGQRPSEVELRSSSAVIYRLVEMVDVEMLRGDAADLAAARDVGGQIGCDSFTFSEPEDLVAGTRYVMFLSDVFAFSDYAASGNKTMVSAVGVVLALNESDIAEAGVEGAVPLTRIEQIVRDNPYAPPKPPVVHQFEVGRA